MKNIFEIIEDSGYIIINKNNKFWGDYPIPDLPAIWPNSNSLSDTVLHLSTKSLGFNSEIMRGELLLPIAKIVESHFPHQINWYETFSRVEQNLLETAYSYREDQNDDEVEIDDNFDETIELPEEARHDLDNESTRQSVKNYLKDNNLPLYRND